MYIRLFPFCFLVILNFSCSEKQSTAVEIEKEGISEANLLEIIEVYPDASCDKTLDDVLANWNEKHYLYSAHSTYLKNRSNNQSCFWTRLEFRNPHSTSYTRILYFPKGWLNLECYTPLTNGAYKKNSIGIGHHQEVLYVNIPPLDTMALYIQYPEATKAYIPTLGVWEMSDEDYLSYRSRAKFKFLLIGVLIFPFLFFLAQFIVQKDKLSLYYLIFLVGSAVYLLTILDTMPFFEMSPKIIASIGIIQRLFVLSTFLTLFGLVKYIQYFLDVSAWSRLMLMIGNFLLGLFMIIVLIPIFFNLIFKPENYQIYLQYFRVWALLIFLYVMILSIWAILKKIKFSKILMLAFSPLIISGLFYASSFIVYRQSILFSMESLILIGGFILTLVLFGVVLGARNNAMKAEKLGLEEKAKRLNELDQFKSRFYTNITHEFRTPLTVIQGMADQIGDGRIKTMIIRNANRLLGMVNQLLDLSKLDRNSLSIRWVKGDIIPYLQYLTESCHSLTERKNINLAFFSNEKEVIMDYDEEKVDQILLNLLSNAIKFTPEYGSIKVSVSRIVDNARPKLKLVVSDTGKGIPQDKLAHIFDRFYQVNNSASGHVEGSGIGLAIVRELVQLLAGQITVESNTERGTEFIIYLPIHQQASTATETVSYRQSISQTPVVIDQESSLSKDRIDIDLPQILIVEDNLEVTEYISLCLRPGYKVFTARNGKEGVEKALRYIPDVIISDIMMPEMDGFELCHMLKSDRRSSHIPIILLTAKATQEDKISGLESGADAYLTKPFNKDELLLRLNNLINISQRLKERLTDSEDVIDRFHDREKTEAIFVQETCNIIEANMNNEMFDTHQLCRALTMSRTQLHRKLKALTGQSTASYIRTIRLKNARVLLETTDLPIGEIALQVGYLDFSHFSRSFAKEFNLKPSQARR